MSALLLRVVLSHAITSSFFNFGHYVQIGGHQVSPVDIAYNKAICSKVNQQFEQRPGAQEGVVVHKYSQPSSTHLVRTKMVMPFFDL